MSKNYNPNNIFAKIIRKEIPCNKVYETTYSIAFRDINARAKSHILILPKKAYISLNDFSLKASSEEKVDIFNVISWVVENENIKESGYRVLTNVGEHGHQEVKHLHFHLLGGQPLGGMIKKLDII